MDTIPRPQRIARLAALVLVMLIWLVPSEPRSLHAGGLWRCHDLGGFWLLPPTHIRLLEQAPGGGAPIPLLGYFDVRFTIQPWRAVLWAVVTVSAALALRRRGERHCPSTWARDWTP